jgi:hypothetical protein
MQVKWLYDKIYKIFPLVLLMGLLHSNQSAAQLVAGDNLGNHRANRKLNMNAQNIEGIGAAIFGVKAITNLTTGGTIGTAASTVDIFSVFTINQTTTGQTITIPAPTVTTAGYGISLLNIGTASFIVSGITIDPGQQARFIYGGTTPGWMPAKALAAGASLSSLTPATTSNTIDNTNFTQTWNWSTATTQTPLTITANALTTGSIVSITSSSTSNTGTGGLLNVANKTATVTGTLARFEANSTAGSGMTLLTSGRVGIGTVSPTTTLDVVGDVTASGNITSAGTVTAKRYTGTAPAAINTAATTTIDLATGNVFTLNVGASVTTLTLNNQPTAPATIIFKLTYSSATAYTITWPAAFKWSGGTAPTLTCVSGKVDVISLLYDGTNYFASVAQNF